MFNSLSHGPSQSTNQPATPIDVPAICLNSLDSSINMENNAPDLCQFLGANYNAQGLATCSGFSEQDYPNISPMENTLLNPFDHNVSPQQLKMPPELKDQISRTQCYSKLGILPNINDRAYLIVDSDLYLWRVRTGDDIAYWIFEGFISHPVVQQGLTKYKEIDLHSEYVTTTLS